MKKILLIIKVKFSFNNWIKEKIKIILFYFILLIIRQEIILVTIIIVILITNGRLENLVILRILYL